MYTNIYTYIGKLIKHAYIYTHIGTYTNIHTYIIHTHTYIIHTY